MMIFLAGAGDVKGLSLRGPAGPFYLPVRERRERWGYQHPNDLRDVRYGAETKLDRAKLKSVAVK